jgi:hypothetical protein
MRWKKAGVVFVGASREVIPNWKRQRRGGKTRYTRYKPDMNGQTWSDYKEFAPNYR